MERGTDIVVMQPLSRDQGFQRRVSSVRIKAPKGKVVISHLHLYGPNRAVEEARTPHSLSTIPLVELYKNDGQTNWTERVAQQCYVPLMGDGPASSAYRYASFNVGPTLAMGMQALYGENFMRQVKEANELSVIDQKGHGNAMAMGFHHTILPLSRNSLDREIQAVWGIEHFKESFGRDPEGFWLPEAAVDYDSLELLDRLGIKFVILTPTAVDRVKEEGQLEVMKYKNSLPVIDQGKIYRPLFPGRKNLELSLFLYDYWMSRQISFEDALMDTTGAELAKKIDSRFYYHDFCLSAVDGETYGHHKAGGDLALLNYFNNQAKEYGHRIVNPGRLLEEALANPARMGEVELHPRSAWSCFHGVGRWSYDCGCEGPNPWRSDLRKTLNFLSDQADEYYDRFTKGRLKDPSRAKIDYIHVLLGRQSFEDFITEQTHPKRNLSSEEQSQLSTIFDALYPQQEMFLSCGWFFKGISYQTGFNFAAAHDLLRRIQILDPMGGRDLELRFVAQLAEIANTPGVETSHNAAQAYFQARRDQENQLKEYLQD